MKVVFTVAALAAAIAVPVLACEDISREGLPADCIAMAEQIDEALASESAKLLDAGTIMVAETNRDEGLRMCADESTHVAAVASLQFVHDFLGLTQ